MAGGGVERIGAVFRGTIAKPWRIPRKQGQLGCFLDQPVAEIVQCGEPAFTLGCAELRLGRRVPAREGCLDEARVAGEVGPLVARKHNHGPCGHTVRHRPWSLVVSMEFPTQETAVQFERYPKSGSGRAFTKRHFAARIS